MSFQQHVGIPALIGLFPKPPIFGAADGNGCIIVEVDYAAPKIHTIHLSHLFARQIHHTFIRIMVLRVLVFDIRAFKILFLR